jgi:hypothetical protein
MCRAHQLDDALAWLQAAMEGGWAFCISGCRGGAAGGGGGGVGPQAKAFSLQSQDGEGDGEGEGEGEGKGEGEDEGEGEGKGEGAGSGDGFSYTSRWASAAGLSAAGAAASYARGEDADVRAARQRVDEELWPAARADPARVGEAFPVLIKSLRKEWELAGSTRRKAAASAAAAAAAAPPDELPDSHESLAVGGPLAGAASVRLGAPYVEAEQRALLRRGVQVALSDLTLAVPAGACFGLLGENGAGKSSTVALLQVRR